MLFTYWTPGPDGQNAVWSLDTCGCNSLIQTTLSVPRQEASPILSFHRPRCPGPWIQLGLCYMAPVFYSSFPLGTYLLYSFRPIIGFMAFQAHYQTSLPPLGFTWFYGSLCKWSHLPPTPSPSSNTKWVFPSVPCHPLFLQDQDVQFFPSSPVKPKIKFVTKTIIKWWKSIGSWSKTDTFWRSFNPN